MQTDIDDAYDHLVALGLAEEGKACIFGYSYGGYAALAAATLTPDKYRCILAAAGPSDLIAMLKWERKEEGGDSEVYRYWVGRITSYNVCYTKLLRQVVRAFRARRKIERQVADQVGLPAEQCLSLARLRLV